MYFYDTRPSNFLWDKIPYDSSGCENYLFLVSYHNSVLISLLCLDCFIPGDQAFLERKIQAHFFNWLTCKYCRLSLFRGSTACNKEYFKIFPLSNSIKYFLSQLYSRERDMIQLDLFSLPILIRFLPWKM